MKTYNHAELKKIDKRHWKDSFKYFRTKKKSKNYDNDRKVQACISLALFVVFNYTDTAFPSSHDKLMSKITLIINDDNCFIVNFIDQGIKRTYSSKYKVAEYFYHHRQMPPPGSWYYI